MDAKDAMDLLPDTDKIAVVLSGGMDSTIAMRLCVEKYGAENVYAISFDYGQKQIKELDKAALSTQWLAVHHHVFDLSVLGEISQGFSANVDPNIPMPTIKEVLGDPTPKTYVPNRNMILMSIAASYAETKGIEYVVMGLQIHDEYGYWDTTAKFVEAMNAALRQNRKIQVQIIAPFSSLSKVDELHILKELDGNVELTYLTLTCYNPNAAGESCGRCPSCSERIANFAKAGVRDPIEYSRAIPWSEIM